MATNRSADQRYPNSHPHNYTGVAVPPGTHSQQFAPRPNAMGGRDRLVNDSVGGQYYPTPNHQYYPPPPPPPRPPQAIKMMPPGAPDPLMPPGTSNYLSNPPSVRGSAPPPPGITPLFVTPTGINGAMSFPPLEPPPLPPLFPYLSPELAQSLHAGASLVGQSFKQDASDLPFIPVIVNDSDLKKMSEAFKNQIEDSKGKNLLLYEDILDQGLPTELRNMYQPLYCKLCKLTLSSPVVARDHYKGKRHKRAEEVWMQNNPSKTIKTSKSQGSSLINGTVTPVGNQNFDRRTNTNPIPNKQFGISERIPALFPTSKRESGPFPVPGSAQNRKRPAEQSIARPSGNNHEFIPAYRAALASPGIANKKPRKEEGSGPNFGFCEYCDVTLTSQANSDQHYNGKKHKEKLLSSRKRGEFGDDPRYGIGSSFKSRPDVAANSYRNRQH